MKEAKEIAGLPLEYKGFTIWQDSITEFKTNPLSGHYFGHTILLNCLCVSKNSNEKHVYNKDITKRKILGGALLLGSKKFKTIENAKKEINSIIEEGYYWMELSPREQKYIKATYKPSEYILEEDFENVG